jgi:hypothetical protein
MRCGRRLHDRGERSRFDLTGLTETLTDLREARRRDRLRLDRNISEGARARWGDGDRKRDAVTDLATDLTTETTLGPNACSAGTNRLS